MALKGTTNEERIWNYLRSKGMNDYGCAGMMGNLYAESGLKPNNLQNTYEKKLGYTDDDYVAAVDSGKYANFVRDSAGFGLAQWTYWSRKQGLLNFAQAQGKSISDLEMQLNFLWKELSESYKSVLNTLKTATSVLQASNDVLLKFERPANQGESVQKKRAEYGQKYYDKYASVPAQKPVADGSSVSKFKQRITAPSASDKYWIHTSNGGLNECIEINNSGSCLPNCVGYAWGRFYEITGKRPALSRANAENWYGYTADGYRRSQTPVVGAVICWRKGKAGVSADGAGHVAIVEEVKSNGDVLTSNSAYGGTRFYMKTVTKASGYAIGSAYTFQGFILPPNSPTANAATDDTKPTATDTQNTNKGGSGMKYNSSNKPMVCMMTQSTCYKGTSKMKPVGVLWHSTGANNPTLKRYVQPDDNAADRAVMLAKLGTNTNRNDWNHIYHEAGLNCWIGKLADGTVTTVQTMPWDYRPWGCGSGNKGSCNDGWIQFEICEDGLIDKNYFEKVYKEACEITAYLCTLYNIDPNGYTTLKGVKVPNILCHADSHSLGLGSNHGDVNHWFPKFGKSMATARADVAALMKGSSGLSGGSTSTPTPEQPKPVPPTSSNAVKKGDVVKIASGAVYYSGKAIPAWVRAKNWIVREVNGDRAVIDKSADGKNAICSPVNTKYLTVVSASGSTSSASFKPYLVRVTTASLNIRKGAGTNYGVAGAITDRGTYTIVEEADGAGATRWGKLKSGAGWISLDYCKKV